MQRVEDKIVIPYEVFKPFEGQVAKPVIFDPVEMAIDEGQITNDAGLTVVESKLRFQGIEAVFTGWVDSYDIRELAFKFSDLSKPLSLSDLIAQGRLDPEDIPVRPELHFHTNSKTLLGRAQFHLAEWTYGTTRFYFDTRDDLDYRKYALNERVDTLDHDLNPGTTMTYTRKGSTPYITLPYDPEGLVAQTMVRFVHIPPNFVSTSDRLRVPLPVSNVRPKSAFEKLKDIFAGLKS